jgi:protein-tyrosine phosphatase
MAEISPHVYLGNDEDANNVESLLSQGIKYVCVLGKYTEHLHPARLFHQKFPVEDHQGFNLSAYFDDIYDYIDDCLDRGKKVLLHAKAANGLGAAVALMWLIKSEGMTYNKAWFHLKSLFPNASPNSGFVRQLKDLEASIASVNPGFEKTRTFPAQPNKKTKNLANTHQAYEYTNNTLGEDQKEPINKYTFTRAPATVYYDVPRQNFTANATSLRFAPQENKTFTPSPHYPVSGNFYHHPTSSIPHERYVENKPELTTKFTPKTSLNFYKDNIAKTHATLNSDFQGNFVKHDTAQTLENRK